MSATVTVNLAPSASPYRFVPDDRLPEGRLCIGANLLFTPNGGTVDLVNLGGVQYFGSLYVFDPNSIGLNIQGISQIKSLMLSMDWSGYGTGVTQFGKFFTYVPDTGQLVSFGYPNVPIVKNVCYPIVSNQNSKILLFKEKDTAQTAVEFPVNMVASNFEMPTFSL